MMLPNRPPTMPTFKLPRSSRNGILRPRLRFPLIVLFMLLSMPIIAMSTPVVPASASDAVPGDPTGAPTVPSDFLDDVTLWYATMTAADFPATSGFTGYSTYHSVGTLDDGAVFIADGQAFTINVLALSPFGNALGIRISPDLDATNASKWILLVDEAGFAFTDADIGLDYQVNETLVIWDESGLSWEDGQQVSLRLIEWELGTCPVGEDIASSGPDSTVSERPTV